MKKTIYCVEEINTGTASSPTRAWNNARLSSEAGGARGQLVTVAAQRCPLRNTKLTCWRAAAPEKIPAPERIRASSPRTGLPPCPGRWKPVKHRGRRGSTSAQWRAGQQSERLSTAATRTRRAACLRRRMFWIHAARSSSCSHASSNNLSWWFLSITWRGPPGTILGVSCAALDTLAHGAAGSRMMIRMRWVE